MEYKDLIDRWIEVHTKAPVDPLYIGKLQSVHTEQEQEPYLVLGSSSNPDRLMRTALALYQTSNIFTKIFGFNFNRFAEGIIASKEARKEAEVYGLETRIPLDEIIAINIYKS